MRPVRAQNGTVRFGGWCLVLLFVLTSTSLGPGMTALLGRMDATHQLCISGAGESVRVVLHHQCNDYPHHHGFIARVLTAFAMKAGSNPDHVIQFHSPQAISKQAQLTNFQTDDVRQGDVVSFEAFLPIPEIDLGFIAGHPPPVESGREACLRHSILLI